MSHRPPRLALLIFGLLFGASYALMTKPVQGPDEERHMYRVFLVSTGVCTGQPAIPAPEQRYGERFDYMDRQVTWSRLPANSTGRDLVNLIDPAKLRPLPVIGFFTAPNLYSCIPYLPAGLTVRAGRAFTDSPLTLMFLGRLGNLLFYLLMVLLAMRILPEFQLATAVVALMPMALSQGGSLSADATTFGASFVFAAWVLRLALSDSNEPLHLRDYLLLAAGAIVAGLCKANVGLVFLAALVPAVRFAPRHRRWPAVAACIILGYGSMAAWQLINHESAEVYATLRAADGIDVTGNAAAIVRNPPLFLGAVVHSLQRMGGEYFEEFTGKLGGLDVRLPVWIPWVYLPLLLFVAMAQRAGPRAAPWQRLLLVAIFLVNAASVFAVVWTTETSHQMIASEAANGQLFIRGIQGRYFIPFILLLLAGISGVPGLQRLPRLPIPIAALTLVAIVNIAAVETVWTTYQAHAATLPNRLRMPVGLWFSHGPAVAPRVYEDRAVTSRPGKGTPIFLVTGGIRHLVSRWPYDVLRISDEELAALPMGPPIDAPVHDGYEGQLVRRPGDKTEDGKVYVVRNGRKHWVWDGAWLALRGYKWPDDVRVIPAADLDAMTPGYSIP
jgi:hypothetical protein